MDAKKLENPIALNWRNKLADELHCLGTKSALRVEKLIAGEQKSVVISRLKSDFDLPYLNGGEVVILDE